MTSLAGIVLGLGALVIARLVLGGSLALLVQAAPFVVVLFGTAAAVLVAFPVAEIVRSLRFAVDAFRESSAHPARAVEELVQLADRARRDGLLALEGVAENARDPFLRKALRLAVDGMEAGPLRSTLLEEIRGRDEESAAAANLFETAAGVAPTMGLAGAVLGLAEAAEHLGDPVAMGAGLSVVAISLLYGLLLAYLGLGPVGTKLRRRAARERVLRALVLEGVVGVLVGTNPRLLRDRLTAFVGPAAASAPKRAPGLLVQPQVTRGRGAGQPGGGRATARKPVRVA